MKKATIGFKFTNGYCNMTIEQTMAKRLLIILLNDCAGLNINRNYYIYKRNQKKR